MPSNVEAELSLRSMNSSNGLGPLLHQKLTSLARFLLLALVVVTPWLFGGVTPTVQAAAAGVAFVAVACWLLGMIFDGEADLTVPVAAVPLLLAALLGLMQLVPLGTGVLQGLSPLAAELWKYASILPDSAGMASDARATISLYPASTRHDLSLLVLASIVFLLGAHFFRSSRAQLLLWKVVAINGAALAIFGMVQQATWNGRLYWTVKPVQVIRAFGPYVNHNNAAGYLNLCLAGAVALLLVGRAGGIVRRRASDAGSTGGQTTRPDVRTAVWRWAAPLLAGCIFAGILCSLSRGAFVALAGAALMMVVASLYAGRGLARMGWLAAAIVIGGVIVGYLGMTESVQSRMATIFNQQHHPDERILHWQDSIHASADFYRAGSGLGTYRFVYRPYETRFNDALFYYAENQYLQSLIEAGIPGLLLLLAAIGLVALACYHLLLHDPEPEYRGLTLAALFALTTQVVHSFFDFGLYLTANMLLLALICGAVVGRATRFGLAERTYRFVALPGIRSLGIAVLIMLALLAESVFPLQEARSQAAATSARDQFEKQFRDREADYDTLELALFEFSSALDKQWDNAELQEIAAAAWMDLYRKSTYDSLSTQMAIAGVTPRSSLELWQLTQPALLQREAVSLARAGSEHKLELLRRRPAVAKTLHRAMTHLLLARQACSLLPLTHLKLAELSFLLEDPARGNSFLEPLLRVGLHRPDILYYAGLMHYEAGRQDLAYRFWRESLTRSPQFESDVLTAGSTPEQFEQIVAKALPPSPELLVRLARERFGADKQESQRRTLLNRAEQLLDDIERPEGVVEHLRAAIRASQGEPDQAIEQYRKALAFAPDQLEWRYELAVLLREQGLLDEALKEVTICARTDPTHPAYSELFHELNTSRLQR